MPVDIPVDLQRIGCDEVDWIELISSCQSFIGEIVVIDPTL
jgi:hypothetical protein